MKNPAVFAKKAFVLAAFAGSLLFGGNSPKAVNQVQFNCSSSGDPCATNNCSYWQCIIDWTYNSTDPARRCEAVRTTYRDIVQGCPSATRCNLNLRGCN